jgi:hypothetical protein
LHAPFWIDHADNGIPGLYPESRPSDIITTILYGSKALSLALSRPSLHTIVEKSHWNSRGWTYQEHLLSPNCLFFTDDEVFYSCPENLSVAPTKRSRLENFFGFEDARFSNWREAYVLETHGLRTTYESEIAWGNSWDRVADPLIGRNLHAGKISDYCDTSLIEPKSYESKYVMDISSSSVALIKKRAENRDLQFLNYGGLVQEFIQRQLTYGGDIVAAFSGILSKLWTE